ASAMDASPANVGRPRYDRYVFTSGMTTRPRQIATIVRVIISAGFRLVVARPRANATPQAGCRRVRYGHASDRHLRPSVLLGNVVRNLRAVARRWRAHDPRVRSSTAIEHARRRAPGCGAM